MARSSLISQILFNVIFSQILAIVRALNRLQDVLHLLRLSRPLILAHLRLTTEEFLIGLSVTASKTIPQSRELSIVVIEVKVVHRVARSAVDDWTVGDIFAIMDHDGPEVDESKEDHIGVLLKRKNEGENMVGDTLGPAIQRMESVGREGTRHDPLVVGLVQLLVDQGMVQASVNPVDEEVGKCDEDGELQDAVVWERFLFKGIVEFGVTPDFSDKERHGQERHDRHRLHRLRDLHSNLVLQPFGVSDGGLVPDKDV